MRLTFCSLILFASLSVPAHALDNVISLCDSWGGTAKITLPGERRDSIEMFRKSEGVASEVNVEAAVQIYVKKLEKSPKSGLTELITRF